MGRTGNHVSAVTRSSGLLRLAAVALTVHAVLTVFSAFAFATFLVPPYPEWLQTPVNQRAMAIGYTYGGQATVVTGAIAGLAFLMHAIGRRTAMLAFAVAFALSLGSEIAGTATGFPFGAYSYTDQLGYRIGGLVPFNIPTSWFYMLVASLAICARTMTARDDNLTKWWWSFVASLVLTAWDVSMDPAMVKTHHWTWLVGNLSREQALSRFLGQPFFFGMPLTNWLGWILTGTLVTRAILAIAPPTTWSRKVAPARLPLALYTVNGLLPLTICFAWGMPLAGVLGALAMGLPLTLAMFGSSGSAVSANKVTAAAPAATHHCAG